MTSGAVELLNVAGGGCRLRVTAVPHPVPGVHDDPWFDTAIAVDAYPFAGTVETTSPSTTSRNGRELYGEAMNFLDRSSWAETAPL